MLTSHELFGFMPPTLAADILEHAYAHDRDLYRATLIAVANARKVRPVFLDKQPRPARHAGMIGYLTVLKNSPRNEDAAYNYEFVSRLRGALAGGRTSGAAEPEARSIQGEQGEPPQGTRKSDFNVIVPLRPEERQEQLDPGGGAEFKRKG